MLYFYRVGAEGCCLYIIWHCLFKISLYGISRFVAFLFSFPSPVSSSTRVSPQSTRRFRSLGSNVSFHTSPSVSCIANFQHIPMDLKEGRAGNSASQLSRISTTMSNGIGSPHLIALHLASRIIIYSGVLNLGVLL